MEYYKGQRILWYIMHQPKRLKSRLECKVYKKYIYNQEIKRINSQFSDAMGHYERLEFKDYVGQDISMLIDSYTRMGIKDSFGMTLFEFLELNLLELKVILEKGEIIMKAKGGAMDNVMNELKNQGLT